MGTDVVAGVQEFIDNKKMLKRLNDTIITLIPKAYDPDHIGDYRPISCRNRIYKIISKMLCTRLKRILLNIVSDY